MGRHGAENLRQGSDIMSPESELGWLCHWVGSCGWAERLFQSAHFTTLSIPSLCFMFLLKQSEPGYGKAVTHSRPFCLSPEA